MKVILDKDIAGLGEIGDIKDVASGYARNFLLPRKFVLPFNPTNIAIFEKRKSEIMQIKEKKRMASLSLKEQIEQTVVTITAPAGSGGKLYGAVTSQNICDEILKVGLDIDKRRIEIPGRTIKSVGNYQINIRLYEKTQATLQLKVIQHKVEEPAAKPHAEKPMRQKKAVARDEHPIVESQSDQNDQNASSESRPVSPDSAN